MSALTLTTSNGVVYTIDGRRPLERGVFGANFDGFLRAVTLGLPTVATPASAAAAGTTGQVAIDTGFIYVCTATNTWKRVAIATW